MQTLCPDLHQGLVACQDDSCARSACTSHQQEARACANGSIVSGFLQAISRLGVVVSEDVFRKLGVYLQEIIIYTLNFCTCVCHVHIVVSCTHSSITCFVLGWYFV